jgi:hypothetical protein
MLSQRIITVIYEKVSDERNYLNFTRKQFKKKKGFPGFEKALLKSYKVITVFLPAPLRYY